METNNERPAVDTHGAFFRIAFRHWKRAGFVFSFFVLIAISWILVVPPEYESEAKVKVRVGAENATLDPSATTSETVNIYQTLEAEVNSMLQILKSHTTALRVVEKIGVDSILEDKVVESGSTGPPKKSAFASIKSSVKKLKRSIFPSLPESRESRAVRVLFENTTFRIPKDTNVIIIHCVAGQPELAQSIAQAWLEAFLDENLRLTGTEGSFEFFQKKTVVLKVELDEMESQLSNLKSESKLVSIEGQKDILEAQMADIRSRSLANLANLESSRAKVSELKKIVTSLPERIDSDQTTGLAHDAWSRMRDNLFTLQIREKELRSLYKDSHPEVIAVVKQREAVESILETQADSTSESSSSPNPTRQLIEQMTFTENAVVVALTAEKKILDRQREATLTEITELNRSAARFTDIERQKQILESKYRIAVDKMEEARILESLRDARISSINVLQNANYASDPAGPGRLKVLLMGIAAGLVCGGGLAFLSEYFNRTFVTAVEVESALGVPVIASIPRTSRRLRVG